MAIWRASVVAGDEAALDEYGRDLGEADDGKPGVFYAAINLGDVAEQGVVDAFGQGEARDVSTTLPGSGLEIVEREKVLSAVEGSPRGVME